MIFFSHIHLDHLPQWWNQKSFIDFRKTSKYSMALNQSLSSGIYVCIYVCAWIGIFKKFPQLQTIPDLTKGLTFPNVLFACFYSLIWRRQWQPTPVLLPGKSHGRRSLVGCSPWSSKEWDTTEWLHFHFSLSCIGEGNGNPLQCSYLENPRDGGAWWAAISGVAQSQTRLKRLSSSSSTRLKCNLRWKNKKEHEKSKGKIS